MTISIAPARNEYTSNAAQTIFNYTFKVFENTDLNVYITPSGQDANDSTDLTTAYTVTGLGNEDGGTITLTVGTNLNDLVTIVSDVPSSRGVDYQNNGDFRPDTVNADFDRVVSIVKKIEDTANRSVLLQQSQQDPKPLSLPTPSAGRALRWIGDLSGLENYDPFSTISNEEIAADKVVIKYASLGVAVNDTSLKLNQECSIKEHTPSKGGGATWDAVLTSSGTAGAGFVASAVAGLSLQLRIVEHMNVKQWGMFGGVNEDTIWQDVIASGAINIFLNRGVSYEINELFNITGQNINGNSCNILVTGVNQVYTISAGSIKNIIFDGNDDDHTAAPSEILASDGVVIDNIRYQNFHGKTSFQTYVLKWEMWGVHNFTINRCRFKNITHDDDGVVIGPGFVGALRMSSEVLGDASDTSYGTISNMRGEHIYSVDAGSGVVQDSDMIRFSWSTVNGDISEMNWDIKFNKITAINVGKRVFKTGGISGCTIKTLRCYKNDGLYGPMFSVINLAADSNRWTVSDAKGTGDFERFLEVSGSDHVISMIQAETFTGGGYGIQYGTVAFPCRRVIASNLNFKGFSSSLYFFDSFDSQANNYVSDSSLGVTTFNKSNGNSNTISNGVHKDSIIITEGSFLFINDCRIEDFPAGGTAYAFDLRDGACRIRGLNISSNSGKRMMNLALMSGQTADIDDVTLFRTGVSDAIANDSNIFSTLDAVIGSQLIVGRLRVVSGANPAGAPGAGDGNALVLFKNVNYTAENIEVKNSAARGTYGTDFRTSTPQGECRLGRLVTQQPVAGGSVVVTNSTGNTYVGTAEIENAFNNTFSVYLGTAVLRGSTLSGVLNAPTTITIP